MARNRDKSFQVIVKKKINWKVSKASRKLRKCKDKNLAETPGANRGTHIVGREFTLSDSYLFFQ